MADKNKNKNKKKDNKMLIMFPMLIISVILAFILYSYFEETKNDDSLSYDKLLSSIKNGEIEKIEMETGSNKLEVIMKGEGEEKDRTEKAAVPSIQEFMSFVNEKIDTGEFDVEIIENSPNKFLTIF